MVRWGDMGMGFGLNFGVWKADREGGIAWNWVGGVSDIYGVLCRRYLRDQITKYVSSRLILPSSRRNYKLAAYLPVGEV